MSYQIFYILIKIIFFQSFNSKKKMMDLLYYVPKPAYSVTI